MPRMEVNLPATKGSYTLLFYLSHPVEVAIYLGRRRYKVGLSDTIG